MSNDQFDPTSNPRFDLDEFIGQAADHYAQKHGSKQDGPIARIERAFTRAAKDQQVKERIERQAKPKMPVRESGEIVLPWRKHG